MTIKIFENIATPKIEATEQTPCFLMDAETYSRIKKIVELSPMEVSWFSHVEKIEDTSAYLISGAYLVDQVVSSSETEMTTEGLSKFMESIINEKGIKFYNEIRCWGHSHVNMHPNPSGQDLKQIKEFNNGDIYIMLIINKTGQIYSALYDFKNGIKYINVPMYLYIKGDIDDKDLKGELAEKVKGQVYARASGFSDSYWDAYNHNCKVANEVKKPLYPHQKDAQLAIIDGQECMIDEFEDMDVVELEDVPSLELVERIFTLATEIFDDFKRNLCVSEKANDMGLDSVIELYCNLSKAINMNDRNIIMNDAFSAHLTPQMLSAINIFFKSWNKELQEIIAYTDTWDADFEITSFDTALDYYEYIISVILEDELEDEEDEDVVSDDPAVVNEIIIKEEK